MAETMIKAEQIYRALLNDIVETIYKLCNVKGFYSYEQSLYGINNLINILDIDRAGMSYGRSLSVIMYLNLSDYTVALTELMRMISFKIKTVC